MADVDERRRRWQQQQQQQPLGGDLRHRKRQAPQALGLITAASGGGGGGGGGRPSGCRQLRVVLEALRPNECLFRLAPARRASRAPNEECTPFGVDSKSGTCLPAASGLRATHRGCPRAAGIRLVRPDEREERQTGKGSAKGNADTNKMDGPNERQTSMRGRSLNCAATAANTTNAKRGLSCAPLGQRANDNQMFLAARAESIRLLVSASIGGGRQGGASGNNERDARRCSETAPRETNRRGRIKLIGRAGAAARLEFIRSSGGAARTRPRPLLAVALLCLLVMQIITILPSCLIIYHSALDCGLNGDAGRSLASLVQFAAAADELNGSPEARQKIHVRVGKLMAANRVGVCSMSFGETSRLVGERLLVHARARFCPRTIIKSCLLAECPLDTRNKAPPLASPKRLR